MNKVEEFPAQSEKPQPSHDELIALYEAVTNQLVKLQVPFVLLAPTGVSMGVMVSSNMAEEYRALMVMNAFLSLNREPQSSKAKVVETGGAN